MCVGCVYGEVFYRAPEVFLSFLPAVLYCNRALCHRRAGDMEGMERDASSAVALDAHSLKVRGAGVVLRLVILPP